jgi:hydroxyquinol 1,2-dioxygenase
MDGGQTPYTQGSPLADLADRVGSSGNPRIAQVLLATVSHLHALVEELRPSPEDLRKMIDFLTEVGHSADARRQEWVLLSDVIGVSTLVEDMNCPRPEGATPNSLPGPFYRPDSPDLANGDTLSRDGRGDPLKVQGQVTDCDAHPVSAAQVEVWHANAEGRYENQEPDAQPEFNLRGRFRTDASGRFHFGTIMPKGYALPEDGPVGRLMNGLGLRLERPAHLHFRVSAPGFETLTTHVFDRDDPAIGRDALFGVKPAFLADFALAAESESQRDRTLTVKFVLVPTATVAAASPKQH